MQVLAHEIDGGGRRAVADSFSRCGGLCSGLEQAGFHGRVWGRGVTRLRQKRAVTREASVLSSVVKASFCVQDIERSILRRRQEGETPFKKMSFYERDADVLLAKVVDQGFGREGGVEMIIARRLPRRSTLNRYIAPRKTATC